MRDATAEEQWDHARSVAAHACRFVRDEGAPVSRGDVEHSLMIELVERQRRGLQVDPSVASLRAIDHFRRLTRSMDRKLGRAVYVSPESLRSEPDQLARVLVRERIAGPTFRPVRFPATSTAGEFFRRWG